LTLFFTHRKHPNLGDTQKQKPAAKTKTLRPSHADRALFAACVDELGWGNLKTKRKAVLCKNNQDKEKERDDRAPLVLARAALQAAALLVASGRLWTALSSLLDGTNLTFVNVAGADTSINLPQAFQWLQEKTLFAARYGRWRFTKSRPPCFISQLVTVRTEYPDCLLRPHHERLTLFVTITSAVLWNPNPGVCFAACDLVRNLVLAFLLTQRYSLELQETKHELLWLRPLQNRIAVRAGHTIVETFDCLLDAFVKNEQAMHLEARNNRKEPKRGASIGLSNTTGTAELLKSGTQLRKTSTNSKPVKPLRQCATEISVRHMYASETVAKSEEMRLKTGPGSAVWTYALFRSFVERCAIEKSRCMGKQSGDDEEDDDSSGDDSSSPSSAPPSTRINPDPTSSVPPEMWQGPAPRDEALSRGSSEFVDEKSSFTKPKRAPSRSDCAEIALDEETCREAVGRLVAFGEANGFVV
jgi:hypothetical protein|tara:strand:- start:847 stop:2259 length:1413 start_codon:yes stop_codon:yes gene_type:complete